MKGAFLIFVVLALVFVSAGTLRAQFIEPIDTPPSGSDVAPPINTSATTQTKQGSLILDHPSNTVRLEIGSAGKLYELCLNGVCTPSFSTFNFIRLQGVAGAPTPGTPDTGFAQIKALTSQQFALRAEGSEPSAAWTTGLYGVTSSTSTGAFARYGVHGRTAVDSPLSYGVYGYASGPSSWAGYFEGRVQVTGDLLIGSATNKRKLCLNDDGDFTGEECIESWPFSETSQFVSLQKTDSPSPEGGSSHISGGGTFSSIVFGTPAPETPLALTCGDGICQGTLSNPDEVTGSCEVDCFTINAVTLNVGVTSADVSWDTGGVNSTGEVDFGISTFYDREVADPLFNNTHGPLIMDTLLQNTTYFYRIISISSSGATVSQLGQFTTLP